MPLCVLSVYFNGKGDPRRERVLRKFAAALQRQSVPLCLVVVGDDPLPFEPTQLVRVAPADGELWCKEALLNVGLRELAPEYDEVCWMDADVEFLDARWHAECSALLKEHCVAQPFSAFVFLDEGEEPRASGVHPDRLNRSFACEAARRAKSRPTFRALDFHRNHPGIAWAARRSFLDEIGGFFPYAIAGHGDIVMATAFLGHAVTTFRMWTKGHPLNAYFKDWSPALQRAARAYQERVRAKMRGTIGCPENRVAFHWWHGTVASRGYGERGALLAAYRPAEHTVVTDNGIEWTADAPAELRRGLDGYFAARAAAATSPGPSS